ncbi:MAG: hypothetical protein ACXVAX_10005 [Pseudobdellovibrio sp.]
MFKVKALIVILWSAILYGPPVLAASDLRSQIDQMSKTCTENICRKPYAVDLIYDFLQNTNLEPGFKSKMQEIAFDQAQIWADTILEGDYVADGKTRIDRIYKLYKNNQLLAYMLTYSEKAWDTSNCRYDGFHVTSLQGCTEGRIVETSFVSTDFKEFFYNEKTYAKFK